MTISREDAQRAVATIKARQHHTACAKKANGGGSPPTPNTKFNVSVLCLSPAEWEARDIPPEDKLLGPFSTTTRTEISADTGLGKTMLGLARAHAIALHRDFLRWKSHRPGRALYVDGEMPDELNQGASTGGPLMVWHNRTAQP